MLSLIIIVVLLIIGFLFGYYAHYTFLPFQVSGILFGSIANWFSVLGTTSAVVTSLWLALRKKKPNVLFDIKYDKKWKISCKNYDFSPVLIEIEYFDDNKNRTLVSLTPLGINQARNHPIPVLAELNLQEKRINKKIFVKDKINGWKGIFRIKSKKNGVFLIEYKINIGFIHLWPNIISKL